MSEAIDRSEVSDVPQKQTKFKHGEMYLVNLQDWTIMPDGHQYKAVYGRCFAWQANETLGFEPRRAATNWYIEITPEVNNEESEALLFAGCRSHYFHKCAEKPERIRWCDLNEDDRDPRQATTIYFMQ